VGDCRVGSDGSVRGSAFATALCARILRVSERPEAAAGCRRATAWLERSQRSDGSLAPSARLSPPPAAIDPACDRTVSVDDDSAVFTTATVLHTVSEQAK
jgi:hypothetical protein